MEYGIWNMDLSPSSIFFNYLSEDLKMDNDLNEYNPFEPLIFDYNECEDWIYYSYPMEEYDWEEWLDSLSLDV